MVTRDPKRLTQLRVIERQCAALRPPVPVRIFRRESAEYRDLMLIARHRVLSAEAVLLVLDGAVRARLVTATDEALVSMSTYLAHLVRTTTPSPA